MKLLKEVRFSFDISNENKISSEIGPSKTVNELLYSAVLVSKETFPRLHSLIERAFANLRQTFAHHSFFVQASNELQAICLAGDEKAAFVFTSALLERFDDEEILFVIGHEFGHNYFKHRNIPTNQDAKAILRANILSRAAEISADRIGLLAGRNLNAATSALIKLATGLDNRNVRFDINGFLRQYGELIKRGPSLHEAMSSHPLFLLRLRAIILFSRCREYASHQGADAYNLMSLGEIDKILHKDLQRLSGVAIDEIENDIIRDTILLGAILVFGNDGKISREEQSFIREYVGDADISKAVDFLKTGGIERLAYEFETALDYVKKSAFSNDLNKRLQRIFSRIVNTFPAEDTKRLRAIMNAREVAM
jgi:hypothetical protein